MTTRHWFVPAPGHDGPPVELTCGRHSRDGRFIPKHVKLTPGISRLSRTLHRRIPMVGDPSQDAREIYEMHMREKRRAGLLPGTGRPDLLLGRVVRTETQCRCGATAAIIRPGKPPHLGALDCQICGIHRRWIGRESFTAIGKFVAEIVVQLGVEPAEIAFRNPPKGEGGETSPPKTVTGSDGKQYPRNGRVWLFPRKKEQAADPSEPAPFNDPIGF